ncbi:MAG: cell wall hydrolase [Alphaproteobacteria bacterium]|nr:cell wall hydrolase [Alphaproteobacteria bacterium]
MIGRIASVSGLTIALWGLLMSSGNAASPIAKTELDCLALNVYWEARSEPPTGQLAVAHLTLNRVAARQFPDSICDVVRDGADSGKPYCQFSWICDGAPDNPTEAKAWRVAHQYAQKALAGETRDPTDGALFFHLTEVRPKWASRLDFTRRIGAHLFYK